MKDIREQTLEELSIAYDKARQVEQEMKEAKSVIGDEIIDRVKALKVNGTVAGKFYVGYRINYYPEISMSKAEELGCVKKEINNKKVVNLIRTGKVKIKYKIGYSPLVKRKNE
jgi:hypothetical protein